ncbi:hypothetical protein V1521DRAFT_440077 [Lipomyces starkeyi]
MTVQEYERVCNKEVKRGHLKLYRAPLAFDPSTVSADQQALPVDPTLNLRLTPKVRLNLVMSSILVRALQNSKNICLYPGRRWI